MRRYAVRFLVAVLTFGIGVVLSLVLGLFKPQQIKSDYVFVRRPPCPQKFRAVRPLVVTVDSELNDPLKIVYLGETADRQMEFRVENQREQTISGFSLSGERIWGPHSREGTEAFDFRSNDILNAGESRSIVISRSADGLSLRVATVTFESGFTWINPRQFR